MADRPTARRPTTAGASRVKSRLNQETNTNKPGTGDIAMCALRPRLAKTIHTCYQFALNAKETAFRREILT